MSARIDRTIPLEALKDHLWFFPDPPKILDFQALFGNDHPVELEVGFGKGRFIVTAAEGLPDHNFFGIEIRDILRDYVAHRLYKRDLVNARVGQGDARLLFELCVAKESLHAIHFYFPDPWWKTKHFKRRLWKESLFHRYVEALKPGGVLHLASDVAMVYEAMIELARAEPLLTEDPSAEPPATCTTNFEDKAHQVGRPIGRTAFRKRS